MALDNVSNFLENDDQDRFEDAIRIESDDEDENDSEEGEEEDRDIE